ARSIFLAADARLPKLLFQSPLCLSVLLPLLPRQFFLGGIYPGGVAGAGLVVEQPGTGRPKCSRQTARGRLPHGLLLPGGIAGVLIFVHVPLICRSKRLLLLLITLLGSLLRLSECLLLLLVVSSLVTARHNPPVSMWPDSASFPRPQRPSRPAEPVQGRYLCRAKSGGSASAQSHGHGLALGHGQQTVAAFQPVAQRHLADWKRRLSHHGFHPQCAAPLSTQLHQPDHLHPLPHLLRAFGG